MALVEVAPCVLSWRDWCGNSPLDLADRMDHRLGDVIPEVVGLLELVREILSIGFERGGAINSDVSNNNDRVDEAAMNERRQRAGEILMRFRFIGWNGGIPMIFSYNSHLLSLMAISTTVIPNFLAVLCEPKSKPNENTESEDGESSIGSNSLNAMYITLSMHLPLIICKTSLN